MTGPVEVGDAKTYIDGFIQGVASVDPSIKVSKTWTGSFSDVALMTEAAKTHIAAGADILTGSSQSVVGSIGAAKENGSVLWFGTQADQASLAPDLVVASQVYDWTGMLKEIIASRAKGTLGGETYTLQLKNDGLKIAYNSGYTLPADVKAAGGQGHRRYQERRNHRSTVNFSAKTRDAAEAGTLRTPVNLSTEIHDRSPLAPRSAPDAHPDRRDVQHRQTLPRRAGQRSRSALM